jgi:hypothetical protein
MPKEPFETPQLYELATWEPQPQPGQPAGPMPGQNMQPPNPMGGM